MKGTTLYTSPHYDKPMYEFILWPNCSNNCKFCWQKKIAKFWSTKEQKEEALVLVEQTIVNNLNNPGFDIMLVGGEIFDNTDVKDSFLHLATNIRELLKADLIRFVYLNTNLLYKDTSYLFEFLDLFDEDTIQRIKFTTSYDIEGRFNQASLETFDHNLHELVSRYPNLRIMANTILTKQVCEDLSSASAIKAKLAELGIGTYYLPYITLTEALRADDDEQVFVALRELYSDDEIYRYICSLDLVQKKSILQYMPSKGLVESVEDNGECGHNLNFTKTLKSGECYICALKRYFKDLLEAKSNE